ncbi:MAG: hypothetical protein R2880_11840 [Deinococcales bacterium]
MKKFVALSFLALSLVLSACPAGQKVNPNDPVKVTFNLSGVPEGVTPVLIGSMVGWDTAKAVSLTAGTAGAFSTVLDMAAGGYEYKFINSSDGDEDFWNGEEFGGNRYTTVATPTNTASQSKTIANTCAQHGNTNLGKVTVSSINFKSQTPAAMDKVYLVGDIVNDWDPGATEMTKNADGSFSYVLNLTEVKHEYPDTPLGQFKHTAMGSWDSVEKDADCNEIGNRVILAPESLTGVVLNVESTIVSFAGLGNCAQ